MNTDKLLNKMFAKVENVVLDMTTCSIGIKSPKGDILTIQETQGEKGKKEFMIVDNIFDLSMAIPAFATQQPIEAIAEGDMLVNANNIAVGWVTSKTAKQLTYLKGDGTISKMALSKVALMGGEKGTAKIISKSMVAGLSQNPMMLMMLQDGGVEGCDMDSMLPMLMMSQMQPTTTGVAQPMQQNFMGGMNPMMMMMMMDSNKSGKSSMEKMLMLSTMSAMSGMGGTDLSTGMNPMMMMAMASKLGKK